MDVPLTQFIEQKILIESFFIAPVSQQQKLFLKLTKRFNILTQHYINFSRRK